MYLYTLGTATFYHIHHTGISHFTLGQAFAHHENIPSISTTSTSHGDVLLNACARRQYVQYFNYKPFVPISRMVRLIIWKTYLVRVAFPDSFNAGLYVKLGSTLCGDLLDHLLERPLVMFVHRARLDFEVRQRLWHIHCSQSPEDNRAGWWQVVWC